MGLWFIVLAVFMCDVGVLLCRLMSDAESREQNSTPRDESTPRRVIARSEREPSEPALREQARLADMQRCIDTMRRTTGDLEARLVDLECSVGRIGSAFEQMAALHSVVMGGASRGRGGGYVERGGRRDFSSRPEPPRNGHGPPSFGGGGDFGGRGRGRR
jgi:hypothetical protein